MRVVVAFNQPPHPEGNAPGKTSVGLILGLRANGVEVVPVAARQHFSSHVVSPADLGVELVDVPPRVRSLRARVDMLRRPRGHLSRTAFGERVRELTAGADVLHAEETETAWANLDCVVPSVLHIHLVTLRDRSLGSPFHKRFYSTLEFALSERVAARRYLALAASSPLIADHLRAIAPRADVTFAPLSLDPSGYGRANLEQPIAGIIGTGGWEPTAAAMRRLVDDVWPLVRSTVPEASLKVAGRLTGRIGLRGTGVEVLGEVDSGAVFMEGLSVLLYPIARGSGMKVKVLEALACGVPVVTTPEGAEGIVPNDGVIIETDTRALADAAAELLRDVGARRQRGDAALATFRERYAPGVATRPLVDLYRRMSERK